MVGCSDTTGDSEQITSDQAVEVSDDEADGISADETVEVSDDEADGISADVDEAVDDVASLEAIRVNSTQDHDDGSCDAVDCTLREALLLANAQPGQDTLDFGGVVLSTDSEPVAISLSSGLPLVTDSIVMDAAIMETRTLPGNPVHRPGIELDFGDAEPTPGAGDLQFFPNGVTFFGPAASDSSLRGFIINGMSPESTGSCVVATANPDPVDDTVPRSGLCGNAVEIFAANNVRVAGNYLNLDSDGVALKGNGVTGVSITDASGSIIGGASADDRNVMTATDFAPDTGVNLLQYNMIQATLIGWSGPAFEAPKSLNNNMILGNYLGVNADGVALNPNVRGVWMRSMNIPDALFGVTVGFGEQCTSESAGSCEMAGNVIEGNLLSTRGGMSTFAFFGYHRDTVLRDNTTFNTADFQGHVEVFAWGSDRSSPAPGHAIDMLISDNRFGIDLDGALSSGPSDYGIDVANGDGVRIENNVVAGNSFEGIRVRDNSEIEDQTNGPSTNVTISQNSIFGNCIEVEPRCAGIRHLNSQNPDPAPNDKLDVDTGANALQNHPVLLRTTSSTGENPDELSGELDSSPEQEFLIEFFASSALNGSGRAEGEQFLGQQSVTTDADGHTDFIFALDTGGDGNLTDDEPTYLTATATATRNQCNTSESHCLYGNTSEFSNTCGWQTTTTTECDEGT